MPDEKADSAFCWRDKLDQLSGLPGEAPVNQAAAWQKLHDRLQQKTPGKKTVLYWIAAACLLCALALSWPVLIRPDHALVTIAQPKQESSRQSFHKTDSQGALAVSLPQGSKKKSVPRLDPKTNPHPALVHAAIMSPPAIPPNTIKNLLQPIAMRQPQDTVHLMAAAPVKNKLRVVHINELNSTVENAHLASNAPLSSPGKSSGGDDLSGFSLSRNASDNIVKIKLSSSN